MAREFRQIDWDEVTADDCRQIIRLAVREDLGRSHDLTTMALVPRDARGTADIVVRQPGVIAGLPAVELAIVEMDLSVQWTSQATDGQLLERGSVVGVLQGSTRDLLTSERILLNMLGRLSGIATATRQVVSAVAGTSAQIYDTRKTTPGWRRMEKYAVRCGGGRNHRTGLFDAVLIKDNHLAQATRHDSPALLPHVAVDQARRFLSEYFPDGLPDTALIEVEVDTLEQFTDALTAAPDIILLDNMSLADLRWCVQQRNAAGAAVQVEASGGITLDNLRSVAETGVERISLGALTHSAKSLDIALDWRGG